MGVSIPVGFGQWTMPFRLTGDAEPMVITCGFQDDTAASADDIAQTISNVFLGLPTFAASSFPSQYTLGPGEVVVNRPLGTFLGVATVTRVGTGGQLVLPQNNAILIQKRTARGGRRGRGRMFLPPAFIAEGNVTNQGGLLVTVSDSITLDMQSLRAQLIPLNLPLMLLHEAPEIGPPVPPDAITSLRCDTIVATQRRRLRR